MGISISKLASATQKFVKLCNKESVLFTKPQAFKGINPILTFEKTGKSFELPRFCSKEMQQARQLNKIAVNQAKTGGIPSTYSKAIPEDLKRLTSETIEDSYKRVAWTNPKDGKVYNLLEQSRTKDGKVLVRVLDHEGALVKEAAIKPKTIALIDSFSGAKTVENISHGDKCMIYGKRHNPFAKYDCIDVPNESTDLGLYNILSGKQKYDYISLSRVYENFNNPRNIKDMEKLHQAYLNKTGQILDEIAQKHNTRILVSSGNEGASNIAHELCAKSTEGVGSINGHGLVSYFSGSRNSLLTQHYETGEFIPRLVTNKTGKVLGMNITGLPGVDVKYSSGVEYIDSLKKIIGKNPKELELNAKEIKKLLNAEFAPGMLKEYSQSDNIRLLKKSLVSRLDRKARFDWDNITKDMTGGGIDIGEYIAYGKGATSIKIDKKGAISLLPSHSYESKIDGTSYATPTRTAKLALNDMMEGIL